MKTEVLRAAGGTDLLGDPLSFVWRPDRRTKTALVSIVRRVHWGDLMARQTKKQRQNAGRDMSDLGLYLLFFVPVSIVCVLKLDAKLLLCCTGRYRRPKQKLIKVNLVKNTRYKIHG